MSVNPTSEYLQSVVSELRSLPRETGWVEFKVSKAIPEDIGAYISALSNTAALHAQHHAYVVWGIEDETHNAVGTLSRPVQFKGVEYIRVGSHRQALKDHPQLEAQLWRVFDVRPFERIVAVEHRTDDDVLSLLDYPSYFDLTGLPLPSDRAGLLSTCG